MSTQSNQKTRETVARHLKSSEYRLKLSFCIIVFFGTNTYPNVTVGGQQLSQYVQQNSGGVYICTMYWSFRTHYTRQFSWEVYTGVEGGGAELQYNTMAIFEKLLKTFVRKLFMKNFNFRHQHLTNQKKEMKFCYINF